MEIVDQGKVPRVVGVDLVVCRHFHPFFEVGENRHSFHWGHGSLSIDIALPATACMARGSRACTSWFIALTSPGRHGRFDGGFDLVHLAVVEGLPGLHTGRLLSHIIVQWDSDLVSAILCEGDSHIDWNSDGRHYLTGVFL